MSDGGFFQGVAVLIPQAHFMPPPDLWFSKLPTEIHNPTLEKKWEIA
jgi:hypothetical protein